MSVTIGNASIDERGQITGGTPGDQTGKEVYIREWYPYNWTNVVRSKDADLAERLASNMESVCANDNIGYDQTDRYSLYKEARKHNWDFAAIDTPCNCDCTSLVADCAIAADVDVSPYVWSGNIADAFMKTGRFDDLADPVYTQSDRRLKRGDILVRKGYHAAIVLSDGPEAMPDGSVRYVDTDELNLRESPNMESAVSVAMPFRCKVELVSTEGDWSEVRITGYCASAYLSSDYPRGTYVTTDNLNLRSSPGLNGGLILTIPSGATVTALGDTEKADGVLWRHVQYLNWKGWVSNLYLA